MKSLKSISRSILKVEFLDRDCFYKANCMKSLSESLLSGAGWNPSNSDLIKIALVGQDPRWESCEVKLEKLGVLTVHGARSNAAARIEDTGVLRDFSIEEIRISGTCSFYMANPPDHLSITGDNRWNTITLDWNSRNAKSTGLKVRTAGDIYLDNVGTPIFKDCWFGNYGKKNNSSIYIQGLTGLGDWNGTRLDGIEYVHVDTKDVHVSPLIDKMGVDVNEEKIFTRAQLRKILGFNGKQKGLEVISVEPFDAYHNLQIQLEKDGKWHVTI